MFELVERPIRRPKVADDFETCLALFVDFDGVSPMPYHAAQAAFGRYGAAILRGVWVGIIARERAIFAWGLLDGLHPRLVELEAAIGGPQVPW